MLRVKMFSPAIVLGSAFAAYASHAAEDPIIKPVLTKALPDSQRERYGACEIPRAAREERRRPCSHA